MSKSAPSRLSGNISAVTTSGYGARGIQSNYGRVNISQIDGQITANSGSTDAGGKFSALGIEAREEITLGNISAAAAITAASGGMDAYGIYAGEESGNQTHSNITIGNVAGTIRAEAMAGTAAGASATGSLAVGDISGAISAASTGNAAAHGLLAEFSLTTGTINGTVSATTAGGTAAALMGGAGITTTIGSTGMVEAAATGDGGTAYALYSGSYTNSDFSTENTADNITVHAGASITGIWELGGSGKESSVDTITLALRHGKRSRTVRLHGADDRQHQQVGYRHPPLLRYAQCRQCGQQGKLDHLHGKSRRAGQPVQRGLRL